MAPGNFKHQLGPVPEDDGTKDSSRDGEEMDLPILPMRNVIVFPYMVVPVTVGQFRSKRLVEDAYSGDRTIGILGMKDAKEKDPSAENLYTVGSVAKILRLMKAPDGKLHILVQGLDKMAVTEWGSNEPFLRAKVKVLYDDVPPPGDVEAEAMRVNLVGIFKRMVSLMAYMPNELSNSVSQTRHYRQIAYLISSSIRMDLAIAQGLLEMPSVMDKFKKLSEIINHELEVHELGKKIQSDARTEMDKAQREYFLRHQLKAIQKELGEEEEAQLKVEEYRTKIEESGMPEEAKKDALRELERMEKIPEVSAEYGVIMTYLDWVTNLPWDVSTEDNLDIAYAQKVLDEDHYNLVKIKERILEYLAVRKLRRERAVLREETGEKTQTDYLRAEREGAIICFVGPPGLGKTSLGQSIARALGRKFHRMSLGGIRDEAEIRGHRRTYIGAMPGRFIQALRRVGTKNPVIMLDEMDKVGSDWRGDPSSALLEVLDPEQNREFRDHYLDMPFDLSQVMFIATANVLEKIPGPLQDRLEVLRLSGYTDEEKLNIAQQYLLPRQIRDNGLQESEIEVSREAMMRVIHSYTREAGVRGLERQVGAVCRKVAVKIAKAEAPDFKVTEDDLSDLLGKPPFNYDLAERLEIPGVATGLAVTAVGGDILFVEVTGMPGKKGLTVTGQLGDVMEESVRAAVSYVRSQTETLGVPRHFFDSVDLHVHIPAGATPKDGPSAGVTLVTALTSLLTHRPVHKHVGMTGEMTLRGKVLPVGGIKDKVLAAHRAGLTTVILPKRNEKDLDDLPDSVRDEMTFVLADSMDMVLQHALKDETVEDGCNLFGSSDQEDT